MRFDPRFFTDAGHPARRLLDEITQRSLAFTTEDAPGFDQFVRLVNEGVAHLAASQIKDSRLLRPFCGHCTPRGTPRSSARKPRKRQSSRHVSGLSNGPCWLNVAADIRKLHDIGNVPADILDFAGPWADVVALAQVSAEGQQDDPRDTWRWCPCFGVPSLN